MGFFLLLLLVKFWAANNLPSPAVLKLKMLKDVCRSLNMFTEEKPNIGTVFVFQYI